MQQRYYDPRIGRFWSVDPVTAFSSPGSNFNRYAYANNNPYKFNDPDGRFGLQVFGGIAGGLIADVSSYREGNSVGEVVADTAIGAGVGVLSTIPGGGVVAAAMKSGLASAAGDVVKQSMENGIGNVDIEQSLLAGAEGATIGAIAKGAANKLVPNRNIPGISKDSPLVRQGRAVPQVGSEAKAAPVRGAVENSIAAGQGAGVANASNQPTPPPSPPREEVRQR